MTTEQTQHARDSAELRRLCSERDQLREKVAEQAREIERLRMQLVACGVVALANTPESAAKARDMHPDYMSASCGDVIRTVDIQMQLRAELTALKPQPSGVVLPELNKSREQWARVDARVCAHNNSTAANMYLIQDAQKDIERLHRAADEVARLNEPASSNTIDLVFDGELPNAVFVEAEDGDGNSINAGHWFQREDGYLVLRISSVERQPTQKESDAAAHRYLAQVNKAKPASAGDERATLSAFTAWGESIGLRPALQTVGELKAFKAGAEWKARTTLSAPSHGEQVQSCATCNGVGIVGHSMLCPECAAAPSAGSQGGDV